MASKIAYLMVGMGLLLSSCSQSTPYATLQTTSTMAPLEALTPYYSTTPTATKPTATIVVTIPVTPSPTPTPFLHTVTNNDTMLGLAIQYGVKLEDLKAANPDVNPNAMSVGTKLVIPINRELPQAIPTPTPMPVLVEQPKCFKTGDGGAWCVVAIQNDQESSLENLAVWIGLYNTKGDNFTNQVANAPLNILGSKTTMPILAYFPSPLPEEFSARGELLSALVIASDDTRYLNAVVKTDPIEISTGGTQAAVKGLVVLPKDSSTPTQVWVLIVAYDAGGNIIGARKWKSAGERQFDTIVYSLGGVIDHVEVLTEARP